MPYFEEAQRGQRAGEPAKRGKDLRYTALARVVPDVIPFPFTLNPFPFASLRAKFELSYPTTIDLKPIRSCN